VAKTIFYTSSYFQGNNLSLIALHFIFILS
jgi:hypothetical protein